MKKIIIMHHRMVVGGVEKVLINLLSTLSEKDYKIDLLLLSPAEWDYQIPSHINIRYVFSKKVYNRIRNKRYYRYGKMLLPSFLMNKFIFKEKYDFAIAFDMPMIWYLRAFKGRKILWSHADYANDNEFTEMKHLRKSGFLYKHVNRLTLRYINSVDNIVCVAESIINGFVSRTGVSEEKIRFIYNITDYEDIIRKSQEDVLEIKESIDEPLLVAVGRLANEKAFYRLIVLAKFLKSELMNFKIIIVGDGPNREDLETAVEAEKLEDYIVLLGQKDNPYKYIAKSKLLLCSSKREAYCTVTKEAIVLGVPFVTTDCSGMREQIGESNCGMIVENDDNSLGEAVKSILCNDELYEKMRTSTFKQFNILKEYSTISEIKKLLD